MTPTKYMINASDINKYKYITGGLWPPAASNFTELTFLPLLILVGVVFVIIIIVVMGGNKVNSRVESRI